MLSHNFCLPMNINTDNPTLMSFSHTEVTFWVTTLAAEVRVREPERHTTCSQAGPVPPSIMTCHCARLPGLGLMQPQLGFNPTKALSWAQGKVTVVRRAILGRREARGGLGATIQSMAR